MRAGVLGCPGVVGFAARAAHDLRGDDHGLRKLVVGEVRRAVGTELLEARRRRAGRQRDDGGHLLTPARARDADDQRVVYGRVALHDALDLFREHLLAAGIDAHRLAPEEEQATVTGVARAVAADAVAHAVDDRERLPCLLGVAQVAERQVALGGDPADLVAAGPQEARAIVGQHGGVLAQLIRRQPFRDLGIPAHRLEAGLGRAHALDEHRALGEQQHELLADAR